MGNCRKNNVIRATGYTVGTNFVINTDFNIAEITNGMRFMLVLPVDLPAMTTITSVYVAINVNGTPTNIPIQDIIGNNLMSDQLRFLPPNRNQNCRCNQRSVARIVYGSNPAHFKVLLCLPESSAVAYQEAEG